MIEVLILVAAALLVGAIAVAVVVVITHAVVDDLRGPLDDKMYDWRNYGKHRMRFENRDEK